jgi:hypothetical protein
MLHIINRKKSYDPQNCDVCSMLMFARYVYACWKLTASSAKYSEC